MPADEKDKTATNRLLDLLRAQQAGSAERAGNESGTLDDKEPATAAEPPPEKEDPAPPSPPRNLMDAIKRQQESGAGQEPEATEAEVPEAAAPESPAPEATIPEPAEQAEATPASDEAGPQADPDLAAKLKNLAGAAASKESEPPEPAPAPAAAPPAEGESEPPARQGPALMTEEVQEEPEPDELIAAKGGIDPAYFQVREEQPPPNRMQDLIQDAEHWFLNSNRLITVYCTSSTVRFMKLRTAGARTIIEEVATYPLPYETDERKFMQQEELIAWVLEKEEDKNWQKMSFVALNSASIETQTKTFKPPEAKGKELKELLMWTAKKNLPFSADSAILDYELMPRIKGREDQRQYVIGVGAGEIIDRLTRVFREKKYNLRQISPLPVLTWKLFQHNYPDRDKGCVGLVHIGERQTSITMLKDGIFQFTREMGIGLRDYIKAVEQRVVTGEKSFNIDAETAERYIREYGIPEKADGVLPDSGVSLYKLSIFLRPVIDRTTTELNRSLEYFRKQDAELDCKELYFTGPGAGISRLIETFSEELDQRVEHLNPFRSGQFRISEDCSIPADDFPSFATNIALALENTRKINLIQPGARQHFRYKVLNKFAWFAASLLIPILLTTGTLSYLETQRQEEYLKTLNNQWTMLSEQSQEYFAMISDLEIMSAYRRFLENDKVNSNNQFQILKLFSTEVPENIKLTSMAFRLNEDPDVPGGRTDAHLVQVDVSGFVLSAPGIADIQLTNFILKLEGMGIFSNIERENRPSSTVTDRLFFTLRIKVIQ